MAVYPREIREGIPDIRQFKYVVYGTNEDICLLYFYIAFAYVGFS